MPMENWITSRIVIVMMMVRRSSVTSMVTQVGVMVVRSKKLVQNVKCTCLGVHRRQTHPEEDCWRCFAKRWICVCNKWIHKRIKDRKKCLRKLTCSRSYKKSVNVQVETIENWLISLFQDTDVPKGPNKKLSNKYTGNVQARRNKKYAHVQELYKKDKKTLREILENYDEVEKFPL